MPALPLVVHPPPGEGTTTPDDCATPVPVTVIVTVAAGLTPSDVVIVYCPLTAPLLCGVKVTGRVMVSPGCRPRPVVTGCGAPNGARGPAKPVTLAARFPVLVRVTLELTDVPSLTLPKLTEVVDATSCPLPAMLAPDIGTV